MIAIVVSLISICVASLSLGWNIYRDIGLKPRVFVKFGVTYTISENLYRVSGFDEISNACNPGYGGAVDDAFFESGNMS